MITVIAADFWPVILTPLALAFYAGVALVWWRLAQTRAPSVWLWKIRGRLNQRRRLREAHAFDAAFIDQLEQETVPPVTEQPRWVSLWLVELFLPSDVEKLTHGLRKIGWDHDGTFGMQNALEWLDEARHSGGPTSTEASFKPKGSAYYPMQPQTDLPDVFSLVTLSLIQLGPGVTAMVAHFRIAEGEQLCLDKALRAPVGKTVEPLGWTGHRVIPPGIIKSQRLAIERHRLRSLAGTWLQHLFPGRSAAIGAELSCWDFLTYNNDPIAVGLSRSQPVPRDWRQVFGFLPSENWTFAPPDGSLVLATPLDSGRSAARPSFIGQQHELIRSLPKFHDQSLSGVQHVLHEQVAGLLPILALREFVRARNRSLATLQDAAFSSRNSRRTRRQAKTLTREALAAQCDLVDIQPTTDAVQSADPVRWWLQLNASNPVLVTDTDVNLVAYTAEELGKETGATTTRANRLASAVRSYSDLLLASSNARLQWAVVLLTIAVTVLTGIGVWYQLSHHAH